MRVFTFIIAAVAACLVMTITVTILQSPGRRRKMDKLMQEFVDEIRILENPDLMEQGLQKMLLEENVKNRRASMADHPSAPEENTFPANTDFSHLAHHVLNQARKIKKRNPYSSEISYDLLREKFRRNL